ncbi:MAG: hypothetical protein JWN73_1254 [Betaproteobacteria bacterium]|nr:hypothetical protein [Betaproteobacteria bacterium]
MSNQIPGITFSLSVLKTFENRDLARNVLSVLLGASESIRPKRYGAFETDVAIDGLEDVVDVLVNKTAVDKPVKAGSLVLNAGKNCEYQIQWNKSSEPSFPFVGGYLLDNTFMKSPEVLTAFLKVIKEISLVTKPAYGDIRSMSVPGWDTPFDLKLRLPDIPNVSIYGQPYIDFFGRDRIENAPFFSIERLGEDLYWLQAIESITGPVPDEIKLAIRKHFGAEAFMAGQKWRYVDGKHPTFDFSEVATS